MVSKKVKALARKWRRAFEKYQSIGLGKLGELPSETQEFLLDVAYYQEQQLSEKFERLYPGLNLFKIAFLDPDLVAEEIQRTVESKLDPQKAFDELRKVVDGQLDGLDTAKFLHDNRHEEGEKDDCSYCVSERSDIQ